MIDTDVVSFEIKGDSRRVHYRELLNNPVNCISFMTLAELNFWSMDNHWGANRIADFKNAIANYVVLDSNAQIAELWAKVSIVVRKQGRHIACADAWNAAVALHYDLPFITHNRKDYEYVPGLRLVSMNKS